MQRVAKIISNAGICSRRDAEILITRGEVKVNGETITSPALNLGEKDIIEVSGKQINTNLHTRLWVYHKPAGLITTHKDPQGRQTVFDTLVDLPRVISVGRLDLDSEGLLLLTNNGDLARKLEHPTTQLERVYKARVYGQVDVKYLQIAVNGITINEILYQPKAIKLISSSTSNSWLEITLTEGKNREIRKIFEHFGLQVNRLIRVQYGPFILGSLPPEEYKEIYFEKFKDFV